VSATGEDPDEVPLRGGITNEGRVSRIGETVRRPERDTSPATRELLQHLERAGFEGAPRHLGRDERGREILSWIDGEAPIPPAPDWALTDGALVSVAELLRRYHDAVRSFDPSGHRWPRAVPAAYDGGLVCHNDLNLDNVVFAGGRAVALIDFDLAAPGSAVWDVGGAARHWVPLRDGRDTPEPLRGRTLERLRLFADAYGLSAGDRERLAPAARLAHRWSYDVVREAVDEGHPAFERLWEDDGGRGRAERTAAWLQASGGAIGRALARSA
jgi:hypothetical protein